MGWGSWTSSPWAGRGRGEGRASLGPEQALSATASVHCARDTVVGGAIAPGDSVVRVKFGDGSIVAATIYARVPQLRVRARYYVAYAKGPVSVRRVRALDARGRTVALGTFDFDQRAEAASPRMAADR